MPPLNRQRTLESLRSWWSDSNPLVTRGPTVNLHAASKPLMRLLYHRQVLSFIKWNQDTPLSEEMLQICSDYLAFKYLSASTKSMILSEVNDKASRSEDDARAVVHSPVLNQVTELLESPSTWIRGVTCLLVRTLAFHDTTAAPVLALNPCMRLVSLLQDADLDVVHNAIYAFSQITAWPDGAQRAVAANILDHLVELLESPNAGVQRWTCWTVGRLAFDESTAVAVLAMNPCVRLVSLLQNTDLDVVEGSIYALSQVARWQDGVLQHVAANNLEYLIQLLESPNTGVRRWTCWIVGRLAFHESTAVALLAMNPCLRLVSLLQDMDLDVVEGAIYALSQITRWQGGVQHLAANIWGHLVVLLESPNSQTRRWTCFMVARLAFRGSTAAAVSAMYHCVRLVSLLRDADIDVVEGAIYALSKITRYPAGAQHGMAAKILDYLVELLESPNTQIRRWTCCTVARLAFDESTTVAVLAMNPCVQLVSLLQDTDLDVVEGSIYALSHITRWPEGAQYAVVANILDYLVELLESPKTPIRRWTCWTLARLAYYESTAAATLVMNPCMRLVSLLQDTDLDVVEGAIYALYQITRLPDGAQLAVSANTLDHVRELLQSPSHEVRESTCKMLRHFASHVSVVDAILALKPCAQLVTLLHDRHFRVRESALFALANISQSIAGVRDVIGTAILEYVSELMESGDREMQFEICRILRNLARYPRGNSLEISSHNS